MPLPLLTGIVTENVYGIEPMWSWGRVLAVAVLLGAIVAPARATDHFNLESRIPVTIEDIEPIERGSIEFQAFGRFSRLRGGKNLGETELRFVLGIFEKTQLEIAAPLLLGHGAANGNGDTQISVLRKFRDSSREKRWPGFAVEAELRLPSGIQRHGFKNRVDAAITALVTKHMARHSFHVNAGFDWSGDESQEERLRRGVWSGVVGQLRPMPSGGVALAFAHFGIRPTVLNRSDSAFAHFGIRPLALGSFALPLAFRFRPMSSAGLNHALVPFWICPCALETFKAPLARFGILPRVLGSFPSALAHLGICEGLLQPLALLRCHLLALSHDLLFLAQRARAAWRALSRRCSRLRFLERAVPPFRPSFTAAGSFLFMEAMLVPMRSDWQ